MSEGHSFSAVLARAGVAVTIVGMVVSAVPGAADARDADGSRLGARAFPIGSSQTDTLNPPEDTSDWRYVKVKKERTVEFRLNLASGSASVTLRLTEATGDELQSASTEGGTASFRRDLQPGIYYVEVAGSTRVDYTVTAE